MLQEALGNSEPGKGGANDDNLVSRHWCGSRLKADREEGEIEDKDESKEDSNASGLEINNSWASEDGQGQVEDDSRGGDGLSEAVSHRRGSLCRSGLDKISGIGVQC